MVSLSESLFLEATLLQLAFLFPQKAAALVAAQSHRASRTAAASLSESSNRRLYCSLTKGVIPQVCGQKSQSFLERQVVGLAPFPPLVGPSSSKHCKCGQPQGIAHIAFKCQELVVQRQSLVLALDAERANMAQCNEGTVLNRDLYSTKQSRVNILTRTMKH